MTGEARRAGRQGRMLERLFRVGVAGCFVGHGAFGVMGKEAWLPYFEVVGIGGEWAWKLMPVVGTMDILIGIAALLSPRPALLAYAAGWALWTALLRPLAGESVFETLERAGNYGLPMAFLLLAAWPGRRWRDWLRPLRVARPTPGGRARVMVALRATTATLLAGHGGLALLGKPLLAAHAEAAGLPAGSLALVGAFELALAAAVALRPAASLLVLACAWKVGTEALYPASGAPVWELVERAGSYVAPLALWTMVRTPAPLPGMLRARSVAHAVMVGALVLTPGTVTAFAPGASPAHEQHTDLLDRLRKGGLVIACRHAITDHSRGDRRPLDFEDRSSQRLLSAEGEEQARELGRTLRQKGVPVGEVFTSPFFRTADSARLTFGRARTHEALYGNSRERRRALATLITSVPEDETNRALMTHQGVLYRTFTELERGSIREGDCLVVEPDGEGFEVLALLSPEDWEALR